MSKKLVHSSNTKMEIYTKFKIYQLRKDFPNLTRKFDGGSQNMVASYLLKYNYWNA